MYLCTIVSSEAKWPRRRSKEQTIKKIATLNNNIMKHKLSFLIVALLAMANTAMAYDFSYTYQGKTLYYNIVDGNAAVVHPSPNSNESNYVSGDVVIPSSVAYEGVTYMVTTLATTNYWGAFQGCSELTSIVIPDGVTSIPSNTFYECSALTEITIGRGVQTIECSFSSCTNLASVIFNADSCTMASYSSSGTRYSYFENCENLTSFTFGEHVRYIPRSLCKKVTGITSIVIPDSVKYIGYEAFNGCTGLTSVVLGRGLKETDSRVFYGDTNITSVVFNCDSMTSGYGLNFDFMNKITSFTLGETVKYIPTSLCNGLSGLTSITIPSSVQYIGSSAFTNCSGLTSVSIPSTVTTIDSYAFYNCTGLTSVTIESGTIGNDAFSNCSNLTSVTIGEGVTSINGLAFDEDTNITTVVFNAVNCTDVSGQRYGQGTVYAFPSSITSFTFGDNVTTIPTGLCLDMSKLTSISIPASVTTIGEYAFAGCVNAGSITIPNTVSTIGWNAFENVRHISYYGGASDSPWEALSMNGFVDGDYVYSDPSMETVIGYIGQGGDITIPSNVLTIGENAFLQCNSITSVNIPNSVTEIMHNAFLACNGMTSVVIGDGVTSIGDYAFSYCDNLASVNFGNNVESIGGNAFYDCKSLASIVLPNSVTYLGSGAFSQCTGLTSVTLGSGLTVINTSTFYNDTNLTSINLTGVTEIGSSAFADCNNLTSVEIPNAVIRSSAFSNCTGLTEVQLGCQRVYNSAFYGCTNLNTLTILDGVTTIEYNAFYGCNNLTSVTIGSGLSSIGSDAFGDCNVVSYLNYNCPANIPASFANKYNLTTVVIGNNVTSIPSGAFQNATNLSRVTIGNSVASIGDNAFRYCSSIDTIVALPSTAPTLGDNVFQGTPSTKVVVTTCDADYASVWGTDGFTYANGNFTLTLASNNVAWGEASFEQGVDCSQTAIIAATPTVGHRFVQWSDGNEANPRTITLNENTTLTAIFEEYNVTVTVSSNDGAMGNVIGGGNVPGGSDVELTAAATCGYRFVQWNDNVTENPRTIVADQDTEFVAYFELSVDTVVVHDTVYVENIDTCTLATFPYTMGFEDEDNLSCWSLIDNDEDGHDFYLTSDFVHSGEYALASDSWASEVLYPDNWIVTTTFALPADKEMVLKWYARGRTSSYYAEKYSVYIGNAGSDDITALYTGTTTASWVEHTVSLADYAGDTIYLAFRHHDCSDIYTLFLDDISIEVAQYTISAEADDNTMGNVTGGGTFEVGSPITLTATANTGYHFSHWEDMTTENPRQITVDGDATYTAYFELNTYTVTVMSNDETLGTVTGGGNYAYGTQATLTATATGSSRWSRWSNGETQSPYTFTVTEDIFIMAAFVEIDSVHDTTYVDVHDTTYVDVHDTTYVDVHDTTYVDVHDTTYVDVHDTTYVDVHDTTYVDVHDTTYVDVHDTTYVDVHDTTYVDVIVHDSLYFIIYDTVNTAAEITDSCTITEFPYTMDFDNEVSCWLVSNQNNDSIVWQLLANYGYNGSICSYISYAENSDDWLISPWIAGGSVFTLDWKAKAMSAEWPETYQVIRERIDNTYDTLFEETITDTVFVDRSLEFTIPYGTTERIAFRYISDDMNVFFIDNIAIQQGVRTFVHDTTYLTDTVINTVTDTVTVTQVDTVTTTIYDTTIIDNYIHDTTLVTDTLWLTEHDTVYIHDTIIIHDTVYVGVDEVETVQAKVYVSQGQIVVEGAEGNTVTLYDLNGRVMATRQDDYTIQRFDIPASGAYLIKIGNLPARKVVVIR